MESAAPNETFITFPLVPSLAGQYVLKNLVLIGVVMVMGRRRAVVGPSPTR